MEILIGCEESGVVREAFRSKGHNAVSCDLIDSRIPGPHIKGDIATAIYARRWDIIFCFFPCTNIAVSGNRWYGRGTPGYAKRLESLAWTIKQWNLIKKLAVIGAGFENPIGVFSGHQKPSQVIQPWQFGHGETKATCLWLDRLPPLIPTNIVSGREQKVWKMAPGPNRQRDRSATFQGIADAMADQWSNL